jgi:hypothetical protein
LKSKLGKAPSIFGSAGFSFFLGGTVGKDGDSEFGTASRSGMRKSKKGFL